MASPGLWTSVLGTAVSAVATLLLFLHVTSEYNRHIQDMGSIAVAYLGLVLLGLSISVTGVAILLWARAE